MHVDSAVIGVDAEALVLGHKLVESTDEALCTTVEHRLAVSLDAEQRRRPRRAASPGTGPPATSAAAGRSTASATARATPSSRRRSTCRAAGPLGGRSPLLGRQRARARRLRAHAGYMREATPWLLDLRVPARLRDGVRAGDPLVVRSALTHVGNSSLRLLHVMTDERSGTRVATPRAVRRALRPGGRRPAPLPDELRTARPDPARPRPPEPDRAGLRARPHVTALFPPAGPGWLPPGER